MNYDQLDLFASTGSIIPPHLQQQGFLLYSQGIKYQILISPDERFWVLTVATGQIRPHTYDGYPSSRRTYEQVKAGLED
jgi:hypothetical protein